MKFQKIERKKTKDKKTPRVLISMTLKEAQSFCDGFNGYARNLSQASWNIYSNLMDFIQGEDLITPQLTKESNEDE